MLVFLGSRCSKLLSRRNALKSASAIGVASTFGLMLPQSSARKKRDLFWIDVDVEPARAYFEGVQHELEADGVLARARVALQPVFVAKNPNTWDREVDSLCRTLAEREGAAFVCMWHHSAQALRRYGSEAPIILISILDPMDFGIYDKTEFRDLPTWAITFDNLTTSLPLDCLSILAPNNLRALVLAAPEWTTRRRLEYLRVFAGQRALEFDLLKASSLEEALSLGLGNALANRQPLWVPESMLLYDNRQRLVDMACEAGCIHVFGRTRSAEFGAMLATEAYNDEWKQQHNALLRFVLNTNFSVSLPIVYPEGLRLSANTKTLNSILPRVPEEVATRIDLLF
jgi:hypothetical protein